MNEETLFNLALEKLPQERSGFLDSACGGNAELRGRVERLLSAHDNPGSFLQQPALQSTGASPSEATQALDAVAANHAGGSRTQAEPTKSASDDLAFLTPSTRPDSLGRLEHYEILEVIGKGGFGTVLKAFDEKLHRMVAIKVLSLELSASGTARQRFIREARTAAAVAHEHVVTIHAVVEEHRPPYLVMQLIDGVTLQQKLDKSGTLGLREILRIGLQMAQALDAAHKQGLVHRDIKPSNILLENGVERVKITDFGLARAVDDASVTQSGTVAGTPMYMSPEQAEGLPIDHRSDLFSLGTVLYAMCTGNPPFRASGTHAVLKRVIDASPRPIREINSEIPAWLCDIIAKLHVKKPEGRFQTAREVAELLGQHLAHLQQPAQTPRPALVAPPTEAMTPKRRRHRTAFAIAGLALFVFVVSTIWMGPFALRYLGNRGEVEITPESGWVSVIVHKDTDAVTDWFDVRTHPTIKLPPGTYKFPPGFGPGRTLDHWEVTTHGLFSSQTLMQFNRDPVFEVARGERVTLRAFMRDEPLKALAQNPPKELGWVQLFNNKDGKGWEYLEGWYTIHGTTGRWKVVDGSLTCDGPRSSLFTKRDDYKDFHFRVEARLNGKGNSGQGFRCRFEPGCPPGYYAAITNGNPDGAGMAHTGDLIRGRLTGEGDTLVKVTGGLVVDDAWFTQEVIAMGNHIQILVNGKKVADYIDKDSMFMQGRLALVHSGEPTRIEFRKIEIKELPPEEPAWVQLFNGKDLDGWNKVPDEPGIWSVANGNLVGKSARMHYLVTERSDFENFHLRATARTNKFGNSGILFRSTKFGGAPDGYEAQILHEHPTPGVFLTGSVFGLKKADPLSIAPDEWFDMEIIANGSRIVVKVNGKVTVDVTDHKHRKGSLALQVMADNLVKQPSVVEFKKIEIRELPPEPSAWVQLFNGKDLDGWEGLSKLWRVEGDSVIGSTYGNPAKYWTALSSKRLYKDFDIRFKARFKDAKSRSGLFIRSNLQDRKGFNVLGYKADMGGPHWGGLWAETIGLKAGPSAETLQRILRPGEFNDVYVRCVGKHVTIRLNGVTTVDDDFPYMQDEGVIGWQINPGEPMELTIKDVWLREPPANEPGWVSLFNGKDLTGWKTLPGQPANWKVEDHELVGRSLPDSYLFSEGGDHENFRLRAEVKLNKVANSGIFMRVPFEKFPADAPPGYEADLSFVEGSPGSPIGSLWKGAKRIKKAAESTAAMDQWFTLEVSAVGPRLEVSVNGAVVAVYTDANPEHRKGHFALQAFEDGTIVRFRKIEIKELPHF